MKKIFLGLFATFSLISATAQNHFQPCITDEVTEEYFKNNPTLGEQLKEQFYQQYQQQQQNASTIKRKSGTVRIIPVVFHVIHTYGDENISKAQILDQMRTLNDDFRYLNADKVNTRSIFKGDAADTEIEFRLATKDPNGNCTDGITRTYSKLTESARDNVKSIINWDNTKYLNIWVVKFITSTSTDETQITAGFANFPWTLPGSNGVDGIVIRSDYVGSTGTSSAARAGRVLTHEIGHYLGLLHTFQGSCGSSNCSSSGDRVCDTPPVAGPSSGCPVGANTCSNDNPNRVDQVENYMDYSNGNCQNMFTWGQKSLMDLVLSDKRLKLVSQANLVATGTDVVSTPTCKPQADITNTTNLICAGKTVTFQDLSWNTKVTNRTWTFAGGTPSTSTDSTPTITYNAAGTYNVSLQVSNSQGQTQITRNQLVTVLDAISPIKTPLIEGFENTTFPPQNWTVSSNVTSTNWERVTTASASGDASIRAVINASSTGTESFIIDLPGIDLAPIGASDGYLNFKVAYALRPGVTSDRLRIFYSTDCGNSYILLGQRSGTLLVSTNNTFSGTSYSPADASEWRLISLKLNNIIGSSRGNVKFRFEALSSKGNSIYLDDINISSNITAVASLSKQDLDFGVYPNPAATESVVNFTLPQNATTQVQLFDITGKLIKDFGAQQLNAGKYTYTINKIDNNLTEGIYFVKVLINSALYTDKIVFMK